MRDHRRRSVVFAWLALALLPLALFACAASGTTVPLVAFENSLDGDEPLDDPLATPRVETAGPIAICVSASAPSAGVSRAVLFARARPRSPPAIRSRS